MNILKALEKEREKGCTLVTSEGDIIKPDKVENTIKKVFLQEFNLGNCNNTSFEDFRENYITNHFIKLDDFIKLVEIDVVGDFLKSGDNAVDTVINADIASEENEEPIKEEKDTYVTY